MKKLTTTQVGFKITIHVEQIDNCPDWMGDEDGFQGNFELPDPLIKIFSLEYLQEQEFSLDFSEEEKCQWFQDLLGHHEVYEKIADYYGEDVNDFYEEGSEIYFSVSSVYMRIF
jgi:hypothetical protein